MSASASATQQVPVGDERRGFLPLKAAAIERGIRRALLRHNEAVNNGGWMSGSSSDALYDDLGIRITTTTLGDKEEDICFDGGDLCPSSWNIGSDSLFDGNLEARELAGPSADNSTNKAEAVSTVVDGAVERRAGSSQLRDRLVSSGAAGPGPSSTSGTTPVSASSSSDPSGGPSSSPSLNPIAGEAGSSLTGPGDSSGRAIESSLASSSSPVGVTPLPANSSPPLASLMGATEEVPEPAAGSRDGGIQGGIVPPAAEASGRGLTSQQLKLEALLSTVVPFDSVNFKSSKALSAAARRGINVSLPVTSVISILNVTNPLPAFMLRYSPDSPPSRSHIDGK